MARKITAFTSGSNEARVACTTLPDDQIFKAENIKCEADVHTLDAHLLYRDEVAHYRPYLMITGIVNNIRGNFPENVGEVKFPSDNIGPKVTYIYDFDNEELAELALKGIYEDGFNVPDIFPDNDWSLPLRCDCSYIMVENKPIMFVGIKNATNIEINAETSGYGKLSQYFTQAQKSNEYENEYLDASDTFVPSVSYDEYDTEDMMSDGYDELENEVQKEIPEEVKELTPEEQKIEEHLDHVKKQIAEKKLERQQNKDKTDSQPSFISAPGIDMDIVNSAVDETFDNYDDSEFMESQSDDLGNNSDMDTDDSYIFNTDNEMSMEDRMSAMLKSEQKSDNQSEEDEISEDDLQLDDDGFMDGESDVFDELDDEQESNDKNKTKKQILNQVAQDDIKEAIAEEKAVDIEKRRADAAALNENINAGNSSDFEFGE